MVRARGQLEAAILEALRQDDQRPVAAREVVDRLPQPTPAITTVLTVLDRLRAKGLVERSGDRGPGYRYRATSSREEQLVDAMLTSLGGVRDRQSALLRFAGELDDEDAAVLRAALGRTDGPGRLS